MPVQAPSPVVEAPNDVWTVDFKGWWRTQDRKRCDPLTVRDAFSRYVLDVRLVGDMTARTIRRAFDQIFDRCGIPKAIQSDNGQPFASAMGLAGLTKLSAWWVSLGIELIRSRPGCPQDNGGHERMHADIMREIQSVVAVNIDEQQRISDDWRTEFNHVRPHEALGMKTPAEVYRPSSRRAVVRAGGHPQDCQRRVVDDRGWVRYEMMHVYVATALAGQTTRASSRGPHRHRVVLRAAPRLVRLRLGPVGAAAGCRIPPMGLRERGVTPMSCSRLATDARSHICPLARRAHMAGGMVRVIALTLILTLASTAIADDQTWHRVRARERAGWSLALVGVGGLVLTIAGVIYFGARSGDDLGGFLSALPPTAAMTSVGGFVTATALPAGATLLYEADHDRKALALDMGPDFFAARQERRARIGRRVALAGSIVALVGGAVGLTVVLYPGHLDPPVFLSLSTLGVTFGATGLALASAGIVLWRF